MKRLYIKDRYIAYCGTQANVSKTWRSYSEDYYDNNLRELSVNIMLYHEIDEKIGALLETYLYSLLIKGNAYA